MSKDAFKTSGSSPHPVSGNGAPVLTGRGVEDVKRRFIAAFEQVHLGQPAPVKTEKQPQDYSAVHKERFHKRAERLSLAALESSCIMKARSNVFEIVVPTESAEELIREALGE